MHIVILDGYTENPGDLSWGELEKLGDLTVYDRTSLTDEDEIISRIGGPHQQDPHLPPSDGRLSLHALHRHAGHRL